MKRRILKAIGFIGLLSLSTLIVISLNIQMPNCKGLPELSNLGMCAGGTPPSSPQSYVDINIYYNAPPLPGQTPTGNSETVIHQNYKDNYGECSWITIVAIKHEKSEGGTIVSSLYDGTDLKILLVSKKISGDIIRGIADVTGKISFTNPGPDDRNFLPENWKGFYYVLGKGGIPSAKSSLSSISECDADDNDWSKTIGIGKGHNPVVILVKDWVWSKTPIDIMVEVYKQLPGGKNVKLKTVTISTNVDNVTFEREKIGDGDDEDKKIPAPGKNYTELPGKFVIFSYATDPNIHTERPYNDIMDILVDAEAGTGPWPCAGKGPDWLQVAAADIYNSATKDTNVTNCVWDIEARYICNAQGRVLLGRVLPELPFLVQLNPYDMEMRFNWPEGSYASFFSFYRRDYVIYHEALHCYHSLPGAGVYDEEYPGYIYEDLLYVGSSDGAQNQYLRFSWDSRVMGFLDQSLRYSSAVDRWLHGLDGDSVFYKYNKETHFITEINFTPNQIGESLWATDIPTDLPRGSFAKDAAIEHIYLYKPYKPAQPPSPPRPAEPAEPSEEIELLHNSNSPWISIEKQPDRTFPGLNGEYKYGDYLFKILSIDHVTSPSIKEIVQKIKQGYTHLYIIYGFSYKNAPYEYDASYFGITHKKEQE